MAIAGTLSARSSGVSAAAAARRRRMATAPADPAPTPALIDQTGIQWERLNDRYRRESLGRAHAALGDEQAQRAYACGMTLSLDRAIGLALGAVLPGT